MYQHMKCYGVTPHRQREVVHVIGGRAAEIMGRNSGSLKTAVENYAV